MEIPSLERERRAVGVMMIPIPRAGVLKEVRGQPPRVSHMRDGR